MTVDDVAASLYLASSLGIWAGFGESRGGALVWWTSYEDAYVTMGCGDEFVW